MKNKASERWTEQQKEWMGYKRKLANLSKDSVSLSKPPWDEEKEVKEEKDEK
jgi:hypothetical protein